MKDLYTAQVQVTSGRDGAAQSSDGNLLVQLAFPKALGGNGNGVNPEQLFVAGYAACFASSIKGAAANLEQTVSNVKVDGEGVLSVRDDGSYLVSRVRLTVQASGWTNPHAVIEEAQRICAYSNATRGNVTTEVVIA